MEKEWLQLKEKAMVNNKSDMDPTTTAHQKSHQPHRQI
jgi:hypothetical protein